MRTSPIHLNSSKQAKLKVSRSKSAHREKPLVSMSQSIHLNQSIHTIQSKKSPKLIESRTYMKDSEPFRLQTSSTFATKTIRPDDIRSPFRTTHPLANSRNSKSFYQLPKSHGIIIHPQFKRLSHQKQNKINSSFNEDLSQTIKNNSPIKVIQQNETSFIKVIELGKSRSPVKIIHPPIRMLSPPKIIKQVVHIPNARQIELERKVKILEMRVGELHNEKNLIETKMNEMSIRLQYQNNFLRQKLNKFPSNKDIKPFNNVQCLIKTVSSEQVQVNYENESNELNLSCPQKTNTTLLTVKPKMTEKLSKSQDGFYQQTKQIQSIKQQLLETEEMLSKQIQKSLKLLEQLTLKQKETQQIKSQLKILNQKISQKDQKYLELQYKNQKLQESLASFQQKLKDITAQILSKNAYIQGLQSKIVDLDSESKQNTMSKQLYDQMEQNNQILMAAMASLQRSVNQSQNQISTLVTEKQQLQEQISHLQTQLQEKRNKLEERQEGNQSLKQKMDETQFQIRNSHNKMQTFQLLIEEKNQIIEQKQRQLLQKQVLIQNLEERIQQFESNPLQISDGCRKSQKNVCMKCGELRRTVIRLNSYLNNCSSQFSRQSR